MRLPNCGGNPFLGTECGQCPQCIEARPARTTRVRRPTMAETTRRLQAELSAPPRRPQAAQGEMTPVDEIRLLRQILACYVHDENRYNRGEGEPFGSISTEVGIAARALTRGVSFGDMT